MSNKPIPPYEFFSNNIKNLNTKELRVFNMCYLHKDDKRCCNECKVIKSNIRESFHIKRYHQNKTRISWNVKCKECFNRLHSDYLLVYRKDPKVYIKSNIKTYRNRAKEINLPFDLDVEYLIDLYYTKQKEKCYYTNLPLSFDLTDSTRKTPHRYLASLDRLIPEKGYIKDNVVWTLYYINRMKNDCTEEEFISTCNLILNNFKIK